MEILLKKYNVLIRLTNLRKASVCVNCTVVDADNSCCSPGDYDE